MHKDCILLLVKLPFLTDSYETHCYISTYEPDPHRVELIAAKEFYRAVKWLEEGGYTKIDKGLTLQEIFLNPFAVLRVFVYNGEHKLINEGRFNRVDLSK
jgi:hypothetical protein